MQFDIYSEAQIGGRKKHRNDDYAIHEQIQTAAGQNLLVGIVCDGVSSAEWGIQAARRTTELVIATLRQSSEDSIPKALVEAIQTANRHVFESIPNGNTTVAVAAIHLDDNPPYGRLYIASVGDSPIFLIRNGEKIYRLNTDHSVRNEHLLNGGTEDTVRYLERPHALVRAIGLDNHVEVDIGFYMGSVNRPEAIARGKKGFKLDDGDTIVVCSDGLTALNGEDGLPFVREDEFLKHALGDDATVAARSLLGYATARDPDDNISLALIFVPGKRRHKVRAGGMSRAQKWFAGTTVLLALMIVGFLGLQLVAAQGETKKIEETKVAQDSNLTATLHQNQTIDAYTDTPTITPSATTTPSPTLTPTATVTPTFTPTPTVRPQPKPGEVALLYDNLSQGSSIQERVPISVGSTSQHMVVDGGDSAVEPALMVLHPNSSIELDRVTTTSDSSTAELLLSANSGVLVQSGQYSVGGVTIALANDKNVSFTTNGICLAAHYIEPQKILFECLTDLAVGTLCTLETQAGQQIIDSGSSIVYDLNTRTSEPEQAITYEAALYHYNLLPETIRTDTTQLACLRQLIDTDNDLVLNEDDLCEDEAGVETWSGCARPSPVPRRTNTPTLASGGKTPTLGGPDIDKDGIPDGEDNCDFMANPTQTDTDGDDVGDACDDDDDNDGITDSEDQCQFQAGQASAQGCPDADGDGKQDSSDNCPNTPNSDQANNDGDDLGDACDNDDDNDGVPDTSDQCPMQAGTAQGCPDADGDGVKDTNDNCPNTPNPDQANNDGDGQGDACDPDDDNDGVPDTSDQCPMQAGTAQGCPDADSDGVRDTNDNCPNTPNPDQANNDGDGLGDACDTDDDNDGVPDTSDQCPMQAGTAQGCPDGDGDGVRDSSDNCPSTPNPDQANTDGDGQGNACDDDDDNDGFPDSSDNCPLESGPAGGCPDQDEDGFPDSSDACPDVPGTENGCPPPSPSPDPPEGEIHEIETGEAVFSRSMFQLLNMVMHNLKGQWL